MSQTASIWFVIVAALVAANLPFVNERLFALVPLRAPKSIGLRLVELRPLRHARETRRFCVGRSFR